MALSGYSFTDYSLLAALVLFAIVLAVTLYNSSAE